MRGRSVKADQARSVGGNTLLFINYPSDSFHTVQEWIHGHLDLYLELPEGHPTLDGNPISWA